MKNNTINNTIFISFSILLLFLNSCAKTEKVVATPPVEKLWLQNLACALPCWQNITPQKTNFNQVMSILNEADISLTFTFKTENEISFQFQEKIPGTIHSATNGTVSNIVLSVYAQRTTLGDIMQILGQPEKMYLTEDLFDTNRCYTVIVYREKGIILDLLSLEKHEDNNSEIANCKADIDINSQISRIILVGNISDSEFWENSSYSKLDYVEWKGYGTYP